jgi:hypothetical protein
MCRVGTTVFSTRESTKPASEPAGGWRASLRSWFCCLLWLCGLVLLAPQAVRADPPQVLFQQLQRNPDSLLLTVRLDLAPTRAVEDVLLRGVPLYFVWQADVYRQRWYWTDKRVTGAQRTWRLAYQPLTRRWRLSLANGATGGSGASLQYALHQNYDSLEDALAVIGRVTRWRVADSSELEPDVRHRVEWRMQLELSLLPRPFQIGVANQPAWNVSVNRRLRVPDAPGDAAATDATGLARDPDGGPVQPDGAGGVFESTSSFPQE